MDTTMDKATTAPLRRARMLIGGEWRDSVGGDVIPVENPATKRSIGAVPRGEAADVDLAVAAAAAAFDA